MSEEDFDCDGQRSDLQESPEEITDIAVNACEDGGGDVSDRSGDDDSLGGVQDVVSVDEGPLRGFSLKEQRKGDKKKRKQKEESFRSVKLACL